MSTLGKAGILAALQLKKETLTIGDGEVTLTEITANEYMEVYGSDAAKDESGEFDGSRFTALLITRCIVDAKGKRILEDTDAEALRNGSSGTYTKLAMAVRRLNGLGLDEKN